MVKGQDIEGWGMFADRTKKLRDYLDFSRITESGLYKKTLGRFGPKHQLQESDDDVVFAAGEYCQNCHAPLDGRYCQHCGQFNTELRRPIWFLISDLTDDLVSWEGKLSKTLGTLLFLPGKLTRNFMEGRRARYIPPIRLYLISTLFFFVVVAMADVAIIKLEFHEADTTAIQQLREQAQVAMDTVLADAGILVIAGNPDEDSLSPDASEILEDADSVDFTDPAEAARFAEAMAELDGGQQQRRNAMSEMSGLEGDLHEELRDAFIDLGTYPGNGFELQLPADMTPEKADIFIENVTEVVDRFEENEAAGNSVISFGDIRYGVDVGMFEPLDLSADAVGLPAEIFDNAKASVEEGIAGEVAKSERRLEAILGEQATSINERVGRWWRAKQAGWGLSFMSFAETNAIKAMDGVIIVSQDPGMLNNTLNAWLPRIMIILLPLFALMLRFWYWGRDNNLMKQLIFSLHFHSYIFLVMSILVIAQVIVGGAVTTWMFFAAVPLYLFIGMKVASRQGWIRSFFKFTIISFFHMVLITWTVTLTVILSLSDLAPNQQSTVTDRQIIPLNSAEDG
jgi:Protein of unknown function (DUF3667)